MAREITYNNFEISLVVFMPNITTNHAITYTNLWYFAKVACVVVGLDRISIFIVGYRQFEGKDE